MIKYQLEEGPYLIYSRSMFHFNPPHPPTPTPEKLENLW